MSQKVEAKGGKGGKQWDDGAENDGVTKISVEVGRNGIQHIKFVYVQNGQPKEGPVHGLKRTQGQTFEINHPDEYLVSVEGTYDDDMGAIQSLRFKTNKGDSEILGYDEGTPFSLEAKDKKIVGFHGYADKSLNSLGAYFVPISSASSPPPLKLEAQGGSGGTTWDDGAHEGVRKVYVGQGDSSIVYVKFEYEKGGKIEARDHGKSTMLEPEEFVLDPDECITSVEVHYEKLFGNSSAIVTALIFKTSKGRTSPPFGIIAGTKAVLDGNGGKLLGFHGRAGDALNALGAYFGQSAAPLTPAEKLEAQGGDAGVTWDDGAHDDVRKIYVGQGDSSVTYLKFEYDKGGKTEIRDHGKRTLIEPDEFELEPKEYITLMEVYYDKLFGNLSDVVTALIFKTSKGRTSPPFGIVSGKKAVLDGKGGKLVGFHGRAGDALHALGAYFAPGTTPLTPAKKLDAQGGDAGESWDDGAHDGVRKVYVGQGDSSVIYVKFEYDKGSKLVLGADHGKKPFIEADTFELDYPTEYITAVEGCYEKIYGANAAVIAFLRFKTNKRTSPPFGIQSEGTKFVLEEKGSKIVGFHGKAGDMLHKVGVHVAPITN